MGLDGLLMHQFAYRRLPLSGLQERDVINSDQLAEVQITSKTVDANGYQFDFDI